jgi:hypothetical protein
MASGKRYVLNGSNMTLVGAGGLVLAGFQTAAEGNAASTVRLTRIGISQTGSTTLEMVRAAISMRDTAGTLTLVSQAPNPTAPIGGAVSGLAGNTNIIGGAGRSGINSSADSLGTYTDLDTSISFANLNGGLWKPDPKEEIEIPPQKVIVVRFLAAPTGLTGWNIALYLEELG